MSATITATFNGSSKSATLTVTGSAVLRSISLSPVSVIGGNPVTGTVDVDGAAPAAGAVVTLSGSDPVTVPATVTVAAGATTATFTAATRVVGGHRVNDQRQLRRRERVRCRVGHSSGHPATARFGVSGTDVTDTCKMAPDGASLECTFDGSTSTAPGTIVGWDWTYTVATTIAQTTTTPVLTMPSASCALLPAPPLPAGTTSFPLRSR